MLELFDYLFFRNALMGAMLVSLLCGLVGSYIVVRRLVFISGGITHASFGGLGLGFYLGLNPIVTAALFAVVSAFGVQWLSGKREVREDSAIAVFWSLGMALGILFIFMTPGYVPGMTEFLFGNILTITQSDLWQFAILTVLMVSFFWYFYHTILYIAFDKEFAKSQKLPVVVIEYIMMFFIALTIVFSIRLIGIVLLVSMLTIPQMTASLFTTSFKGLIILSVIIGVLSSFTGLMLSYLLNVPSGAFIIIVSIIFYTVAKLYKSIRS
ncbi:MAG: metal ABC transporter permease [Bacteroidales bacterium]